MCIFCERAQQQLADGITPSQRREAENCDQLQERRVRTTIVTGFLGAGKTTFLNFILKSQHGRRLGVVQNEFGSVSVDDQLMIVEKNDHEVVVMPNGCLCCKVRGDLVEALQRMAKAWTLPDGRQKDEEKLEHLIVECSGLSEVLPVAQTFFADAFVQAAFRLDGVVCVVDAMTYSRVAQGARENPQEEASDAAQATSKLMFEQLSISDICLLNKCDLVSSQERDNIKRSIKEMNPAVQVVPCRHGKVNLSQVLNTNSFSLDRALALDDHFLSPGQIPAAGAGFQPAPRSGKRKAPSFAQAHVHEGFSSIGFDVGSSLIDLEKFQDWLRDVVTQYGDHIVRMKGLLRTPGRDNRTVVQGVGGHIELGEEDTSQASGDRHSSRFVIIGQLTSEMRADLQLGFLNTIEEDPEPA